VKLSQGEVFDLMAYVDGELDGEAKTKAEKLVAENADARRLVDEMRALGPIVQKVYEPPAASASEGIADFVMAKIAEGEPPARKSIRAPKLVDLRAEREKRIKVGAAIAAAIALAAGVAFMTQKVNEQHRPIATPTPPVTAPAPAPAPVASEQQAVVAAAGGVDVEQVDSPKEVSVFYLPSATDTNASSVVVWIDDKAAGTP
jgi:hypothetical protein